jgi:hypothetical protein
MTTALVAEKQSQTKPIAGEWPEIRELKRPSL